MAKLQMVGWSQYSETETGQYKLVTGVNSSSGEATAFAFTKEGKKQDTKSCFFKHLKLLEKSSIR